MNTVMTRRDHETDDWADDLWQALNIESSNLHLHKAQLKKYHQVLDQTPLEIEDLSPQVNHLPFSRYQML